MCLVGHCVLHNMSKVYRTVLSGTGSNSQLNFNIKQLEHYKENEMLLYLLWRNVERHSSEIDFRIGIDAWQHEEYTYGEKQ